MNKIENLLQYYESLGFIGKGLPFEETVAERESINLEKYFVCHQEFLELLGSYQTNPNCLFFAPRGYGKTALAMILKTTLYQKTYEYGTALVVNFKNLELLKVLELANNDLAELNLNHYITVLLGKTKTEILNFCNSSKSLTNAEQTMSWLDSIMDCSSLDNFLFLVQHTDNPFKCFYFIFDSIEELAATSSSPENCFALVKPILTAHVLLNVPNFSFKFFLPLELQTKIKNDPDFRLERLKIIKAKDGWYKSELLQLLKARINYYNKKYSSLSRFSTYAEMDENICELAKGSPRNLIILCKYLFEEQFKLNPTQGPGEDALQKAHERFEEENLKEKAEIYTKSRLDATTNRLEVFRENIQNKTQQTSTPKLILKGKDIYIDNSLVTTSFGIHEFKLLFLLFEKVGQTVSYEELLNQIYKKETTLEVKADGYRLRALADRIRSKLAEALNDPNYNKEYFVKTVKGRGYLLQNALPAKEDIVIELTKA